MYEKKDNLSLYEFCEYIKLSLPDYCPKITSIIELHVKLKTIKGKVTQSDSYKKLTFLVTLEILIVYFSKECIDGLHHYDEEKELTLEIPYNKSIKGINLKIDDCKLSNFYNNDVSISLNLHLAPKDNCLIEDINLEALINYNNNNNNNVVDVPSVQVNSIKNKLILMIALLLIIKNNM